jgi:hypothetical protein
LGLSGVAFAAAVVKREAGDDDSERSGDVADMCIEAEELAREVEDTASISSSARMSIDAVRTRGPGPVGCRSGGLE